MKIVLFLVVTTLLFSACSSKKNTLSEKEYKRSNISSEKALNKLDRE